MSVEHPSPRTPDDRATEDDRSTEDRATSGTDVELEYHSPVDSPRSQSTAGRSRSATAAATDASDAAAAPLSHRIERTKLQTRVTALERALETSEHRQHEIVTQYERLLAERTDEQERAARADDADAARGERQEGQAAEGESDAGLLKRLLERWR